MSQHHPAQSQGTTTIAEIAAKFGNIHHFRKALIESGKHIISAEYLNWNYVSQVVRGTKKLIEIDELDGFVMLPKLLKQNERLCQC